MHILLIHQAFVDLDEAGGTRHAELARYLVEHGHRVTIIASPVSYLTGRSRSGQEMSVRSDPLPNLTIYRCYTYGVFHRSFARRVLGFFSFMVSSFIKAMRVGQVDLVWGTSPPIFQGATAWLVARLKRVRFLFEVRDLWPEFAIAVGVLRNPLLITASEWLERFLYRHADRVVVNSPGFIEPVKSKGARQVTLIPNSVDVEMFKSGSPAGIASRPDLKGRYLVLYAGAHGLSNDLDILLDAAALLRKEDRIRILLVGDGKEKPRLMERAVREKLDNVVFLPPQSKLDMPGILNSSDACLAILKPLDLYKTTYPNKVFDYMAAGKPVILAIDGVIREVVEAAHAGRFVEPGNPTALADAIREFASHPAEVEKLGLSGRRYVAEHFDRKMTGDQFGSLLKEFYGNG